MFGDYLGGVWEEVVSCGGGNCGEIGVGLQVEFQVDFWGGKAVRRWRMKAGCLVDLGEQIGEVLRPGRVLDY